MKTNNNKFEKNIMDMCLCPNCIRQFREVNSYIIKRANNSHIKERCDFCNFGYGYDYHIISKRNMEEKLT